ncbi:MAG: hypothetical protein FWG61_08775 [Firmicutes bacterium]|nr:hypothetical protein [Bacillota bacterium]
MFVIILIAIIMLIAGIALFLPMRGITRLTQNNIALKFEAMDACKEMLREAIRSYQPWDY